MIYINIKNKWYCYFFFQDFDLTLMSELLQEIECSKDEINKAYEIMQLTNSGFTFTNSEYRTSIIGISDCTSREQWFNTLVHELKHVQSHICKYYDVSESGEDAAYLIGYLMQKIIKSL